MRDIVNSILQGNYIQASGSLSYSVARIETDLSCDCDYEGTFSVQTTEGGTMQGWVLSSDMRMEILTPNIAGPEADISYHFHGDLCKPGDEIKGQISIVSDHGEYSIPFDIRIEPGDLPSSMGPIRNLFNFVNLAKSNWDEALELFYSPDFRRIFCGTDEYYNGLYSCLSANVGNPRNLEEFLLCTGKKSRVQYYYEKKIFETAIIGVEYSEKLVERELEIMRSGWGYTDIDIEIDGDFILTRRENLCEKDFTGNFCVLKIFIDTEKCSRGRREGRIVLRNSFTALEIPVIVKGRSEVLTSKRIRTRSLLMEQMTRDYILNRLGLLDDKEWFEKTSTCVEQLSSVSVDDPYVKLFKARLLCIDGRPNEASWLVDQASEIIEHEEREGKLKGDKLLVAYAYHWLVASMVKQDKEFTKLAASKVESLYRKLPESWEIGIVTLMLPTTNNANTYTRWAMLEKLFESGCRSGVIYHEGIKVLNENPAVAKKVDGFFIQTVYFGARLRVVGSRCIDQLVALSQRTRKYTYVHLHTLELLYTQTNDRRLLQELAAGNIAEGRVDKAAHNWYRKAIDQDIKLTNLFEYFIESLDVHEEEEIPVVVLMYFGYSNNLTSEKKAYFYYYLIQHKEQYEDLYVGSIQNMEFFANEQISKGNINRHLALVYSEILNPEILTRQQAIGLSDIIFSRWIVCEKKECEHVLVYQKGCENPFVYDLHDGEGAISVYGQGNIVVFEDHNGNRYVESAKYTSQDLMTVGRYLSAVTELVWDNERLNLYMLGTGNSTITATSQNISRFMQLAESKLVRRPVRQRMLVFAMDYYSIHDDEESFERAFRQLDLANLSSEQMGILFPILNKYGHEDITGKWLENYGPYFVSRSHLKRYLERVIGKLDKEKAPEKNGYTGALLAAAIHVFREGNAGLVITQFLASFYEGTCRELAEIWKSLRNYDVSRKECDKRIMLQHMFSGAYLSDLNDIARECVENEPGTELSMAIIAQGAYNYFIGKDNVDEKIIPNIARLYKMNSDMPVSTKLAYLKYYSNHLDEINEESGEILLQFLKEEISDRVYFGFFKKFLYAGAFKTDEQVRRCESILEEIADRTIIDYKVSKGKIAKIHYIIANDGEQDYDYASENMREACSGICIKDFILFFGETLQYYITEESEDEASLQCNGQITCNNTDTQGTVSRYSIINDLIVSNTTKDYRRFDDLYEEYSRREFINSELFRLI